MTIIVTGGAGFIGSNFIFIVQVNLFSVKQPLSIKIVFAIDFQI